MPVNCDVLVIGAGPAGLTAALSAARSGAHVFVVDEQNQAGGSLLGSDEYFDVGPAYEWVRALAGELENTPEVQVLRRTTAFGAYSGGIVLALQRCTDHLGCTAPQNVTRQRVWRIRATQTVIATGALERGVVFADNDRPGIMLAGTARTHLHRYGVVPGSNIATFTTNDSGYAAALELAEAGVDVRIVVDTRLLPPAALAAECAARGIEVRAGHAVTGTAGGERIAGAHIAPVTGGESDIVSCDALLVSGGWTPDVHLSAQRGGTLRYASELGAYVPGEDLPATRVAGSATGVSDLTSCVAQGREAGRGAAYAAGFTPAARMPLPLSDVRAEEAPPEVLWMSPGTDEPDAVDDTRFVDLLQDSTVSDVYPDDRCA